MSFFLNYHVICTSSLVRCASSSKPWMRRWLQGERGLRVQGGAILFRRPLTLRVTVGWSVERTDGPSDKRDWLGGKRTRMVRGLGGGGEKQPGSRKLAMRDSPNRPNGMEPAVRVRALHTRLASPRGKPRSPHSSLPPKSPFHGSCLAPSTRVAEPLSSAITSRYFTLSHAFPIRVRPLRARRFIFSGARRGLRKNFYAWRKRKKRKRKRWR